MGRVLLDCSELAGNPVGTGIQRVVRGLLREWPAGEMEVVRFVAGVGLCAVPREAVEVLAGEAAVGEEAGRLAARVAGLCGAAAVVEVDGAAVVIPEVFYDPVRCAFYEGLLARGAAGLGMLAFDFLPWTDPGRFRVATVAPLMPYLRLIGRADAVAFISARTRGQFVERVMRSRGRVGRAGPVLTPGADGLGADGLGVARQAWSPARRGFVCLGTIEARKNQAAVVEAFIGLWEAGHEVGLTLCGGVLDGADTSWMGRARGYAGFRWVSGASDAEVAGLLGGARATIYASEAEGYGLPPVESLQAGVPVIVHAAVPSVAGLPPLGLVRLEEASPGGIAGAIGAAVLAMLDDGVAARLWAEAAEVRLPGWGEFAAGVAAWAGGIRALGRVGG